MNFVLKSLASSDVSDLQSWNPPLGTPWEVNVLALVGAESDTGAEGFQFQLCSLEFILQHIDANGAVLTGRRAIVRRFDYLALHRAVEAVIAECATDDWTAFAEALNWYMQWEFENYHP